MIDERYVLSEERLRNWEIIEGLNAVERIEQSREEYEKEARLVYNVGNLKVIQYFFYNSEHIFCYWTIDGEEYDKTHMSFERNKDFIEEIFPIVCKGLAMFLLEGIKLYLYNHKVKKDDFVLERVTLTPLTIKTNSPFGYIIFNKDESIGFEVLFNTDLLKRLQKIMFITENDIILNNTPPFIFKKLF